MGLKQTRADTIREKQQQPQDECSEGHLVMRKTGEKDTVKKRIHKERGGKKWMYKKIVATEWNGEKIKIVLKQNKTK